MTRVVVGCFAALLAACDAGLPPVQPPAPSTGSGQRWATAGTDAAVADSPPTSPDAADPLATYFANEDAPMVSRDGAYVLLSIVDDDSARGAENLALEVRDRRDRIVARVVVLAIDEELDAATRAVRAQAAQKLVASHDWIPLSVLPGGDGGGDRESEQFENGELAIDWKAERMTIRERTSGKRLVDRSVPKAWRGTSYFDKAADLTCDNPDYLNAAYGLAAHKLAVIDVAYRGNDTCWEPTSELHVVSW